MATLVFSGIGTMLGGPIGGTVGNLMGRQVDAAIFGASRRQGPRLKELAVTTSSYGQVLPRHFGRMRVGGTIVWATELAEHSEAQGTGKSGPGVTAYSYSANFAVALASRPILGIGRVWADGKLLRGAAGDLKVGGAMRIHIGAGDQAPDPLILAAETTERCPAFRGIAYVVFEGLELAEFYNRIPSLTFEVIADESFDLQALVGEVVGRVDGSVPLPTIAGYTSEGPPAADIEAFDQVLPLEIDAAGERLLIARERTQEHAIALSHPAIPADDDGFGAVSGFTRHRAPAPTQPPTLLRYYDSARDYQASVQRATGRPGPGEPGTIELPAALDASHARNLIESTARRADWSRDRISWRTSELDTTVAPGALVTLPAMPGLWRVREWEWRESGVELSLHRHVPDGTAIPSTSDADPGRGNPPADAAPAETRLVAFELPFDPASGTPDAPRCYAAVSATSANWPGAALFADRGDGELHSLGPSGRTRAVMGTTGSALPDASPLLIDREAALLVTLVDPAMQLASIDTRQLAQGINLALVGNEIVQFLNARLLGDGRWRLSGLLRGQGGTEGFIRSHAAGEPFVLLGSGLVPLDGAILGTAPDRRVSALGRGDAQPVVSPVLLNGITLRPLAPVHPRKTVAGDATWTLSWTRRARGLWPWRNGSDMPLAEEAEAYLVTAGPADAPLATWSTATPRFKLSTALREQLSAQSPGAEITVRQQGTHDLSPPLTLCTLP